MRANPKWETREAWLEWVKDHMAKYFSPKATIKVENDDFEDDMRITVNDPGLGSYKFSLSPSDEFFMTCVSEDLDHGEFYLTIPNPQDMWLND